MAKRNVGSNGAGDGEAIALLSATAETASDEAREHRYDDEKPYTVDVEIEGVAATLFHRYDCEEVEAKGKAAKGSKSKKTDNVESYVYRNEKGEIAISALCIKGMLRTAAKSMQDPRSPRKSASDLVRASLLISPDFPSYGKKTWDFIDKRGCVVQQSRITRSRPAMNAGWRLSFEIKVLQPHYIGTEFLEKLVRTAGDFVGLSDFRPDFGRFVIRRFERNDLS